MVDVISGPFEEKMTGLRGKTIKQLFQMLVEKKVFMPSKDKALILVSPKRHGGLPVTHEVDLDYIIKDGDAVEFLGHQDNATKEKVCRSK